MSKISLEPNASGAGTFTLAAPNSNTNRTLTLPDASGSIVAADASTGRFDSSNMPAGVIVGVKSFITDQNTTRAGSNDSTATSEVQGLRNLSYNLASSSNRLIVNFSINWSGGGGIIATSFIKIRDNGTNIITSDAILAQSSNTPIDRDRVRSEQMNGTFEYTPNSPSVSLTVRFAAPINGGDVTINGDYNDSTSGENLHSSLTIFEVQT